MHFRRSPLLISAVAAALVALGVAACGGGGGGGGSVSPAPTPTPTTIPTIVPSPCPTSGTGCPFAFNSDPVGQQVFVNGTSIGNTPISYTLPFLATPSKVMFGTSSYSATINQNGTASQIVFYNSVADTGDVSVSGVGVLSKARTTGAISREPDNITARRFGLSGRASLISDDAVYVKYDASQLSRDIAVMERAAGARGATDILSSVAATRGRIVRPQNGVSLRALTANLQGQRGVLGVYPTHVRAPLGISYVQPNDPFFGASGAQWDMAITGATYAWSLTQGTHATIAIIDSGVDDTQPDFANKIVREVGILGGVVTTGKGAATDQLSHGTNVAGIADAQTNDSVAFAGVGFGAKLMAYDIFGPSNAGNGFSPSADTADEALAIADAVSHGADVINLSIGSPQYDPPTKSDGFDQAEHDAIEAAISAGVVVVAASGNGDSSDFSDNVRLSTIDYPAGYANVIAVGATALQDNNQGVFTPSTGVISNATEVVAAYSNYGPGLTLVAPGGDTSLPSETDPNSGINDLHWIVNDGSTADTDFAQRCKNPTPGQCKLAFQGTSQAAPHVTGTVALVQSALREQGKSPLSPAAMSQLLQGTADNINDPYQGAGRLNTLRAVASAIGVPLIGVPTPPPASAAQYIAFAYTNSGSTSGIPVIADVTYPRGIPLTAAGTFRIADVDPSRTTGSFKIGVWLDTNGNGVVDTGDAFGSSSVSCTANSRCSIGSITLATVGGNGPLTLP